MRSRKKAPMLATALQGRRPVYPPGACRSCSSCVAARPSIPAGHCPACVTRSRAGTDTAAPRTPGSAGPRLHPVMAADPRRRIPAFAALPWRCQPGHSGRAQSGKGPSMYEMEGPLPGLAAPAGQLPGLAARRAARRGQVPVRGTGLPAPPTFPGLPPGGARFRTVTTFLLPLRAPRKSPRPAISRFPLFTKESTGNGQLSAFDGGYPPACSQHVHRLPWCEPENTATAGAECWVSCNQLAT
jgi:hypothetical protein